MWLKITGIMGIVLLVVLAGFYWYYKDSQAKMMTLQANNAKLELAVKTNEETIKTLQQDYQQAAQQMTQVNTELNDSRLQNKELQLRLSKHELGALAAAKPGLVQNTVNNATTKAGRCFEILSGAPLTTKEREAKNAKEFNSECPWLFDGSPAN
jgi:chromosome segregation ATPase